MSSVFSTFNWIAQKGENDIYSLILFFFPCPGFYFLIVTDPGQLYNLLISFERDPIETLTVKRSKVAHVLLTVFSIDWQSARAKI